MSDTLVNLRRKINSAGELQSVVRTMKAVAASSIGQYEKSLRSLDNYYKSVELGLAVSFRHNQQIPLIAEHKTKPVTGKIGAVVFGSDQGLVGQFNDVIAEYAVTALAALPGKSKIWAVGERVNLRLADTGLPLMNLFAVPNSINTITPLVGQILIECEMLHSQNEITELYLFYNQHTSNEIYSPVSQRLLPLDEKWMQNLINLPWPTKNLPQVIGESAATLQALTREYLFISLFRACTESLASENASRLAAMQRADKNIDELLENLNRTFHRLRQSSIDEELFDVVSGFEALNT
ncbi:MAG: F0F1 ATP synthase subunit gamma, partial [bacterium]